MFTKEKKKPTSQLLLPDMAQAEVREVCATDVKSLALLMGHHEAICWRKQAVCILKIQVLVTVNAVEQEHRAFERQKSKKVIQI